MSSKTPDIKRLPSTMRLPAGWLAALRTTTVQTLPSICAKSVHVQRTELARTLRDTLPAIDFRTLTMLAPKDFLDALTGTASRLFSGDTALPKSEIESQFKALLQSGFSKLDLVSREEFDSQMVVLARTRARLESLEAKVAELEAKLNPPTE